MPCGKIGKVDISRLFLGGNLIGGWAHSRDLLYVSKLFKAYNTEQKIFETLELAEQCGVNTILIDPRDWEPVLKYNRERKRNFQSLVCTLPDVEKAKMADHIKQIVDKGAHLIYIHGLVADGRTMTGHNDELGHIIDLIKSHGVPAGIGGHSLETVIASEKNKLNPDFYVKTFHMDRYWSATVPEKREEWCWYKPMSSDLIVMKAFAARAKDWLDVEGIIIRQTGKLDWAYIRRELHPLAELKEAPSIMEELERRRAEFEQ